MKDKLIYYTHYKVVEDEEGVWKFWYNQKEIVGIKRIK